MKRPSSKPLRTLQPTELEAVSGGGSLDAAKEAVQKTEPKEVYLQYQLKDILISSY